MNDVESTFHDVWEVNRIEAPGEHTYHATIVVGRDGTTLRVSLDSEELYKYLLVDFEPAPNRECDGELVYLASNSGNYKPTFDPTQALVKAVGPEDYGMVRSLLFGLEAWTREPTGHYAAHAGCVASGTSGCLLVGAGGSGKSFYSLLLALQYGYQVVNDDWIDLQLVEGNILAKPVDDRLRVERSLLSEIADFTGADIDHGAISYELRDENGEPEGLLHPAELGIQARDECEIEDVILLVESPVSSEDVTAQELATLVVESNRHIPGGIVADEIPQYMSAVRERNELRREFWIERVTANCSFDIISTQDNTRSQVAAFVNSRLRS